MTTCQSYINEYSFFDAVYDVLESTEKELTVTMYDYENAKRQITLNSFFENSDSEDEAIMLEKEGEGILSKIGNMVVNILKALADAIKSVTDKIFGNTNKMKDDVEIVNQMMTEHPELAKEVAKGIREEWFTYKDVSQFEKDITGLINMLEKNAIDHETFLDKIKNACNKFNDSAKPIITAGTTVASAIGVVGKVGKACKEGKSALVSFNKTAEEFKERVDKNYTEHDVNKAKAIMNAISNAIGLTTKECNDRVAGQGKFSSWIASITKRDERHQKAREARDERTGAKKERLNEKYAEYKKNRETPDNENPEAVNKALKRKVKSEMVNAIKDLGLNINTKRIDIKDMHKVINAVERDHKNPYSKNIKNWKSVVRYMQANNIFEFTEED